MTLPGVSLLTTEPSASAGQLSKTPDMRTRGLSLPRTSVNAVLTSNSKHVSGEYRERGCIMSASLVEATFSQTKIRIRKMLTANEVFLRAQSRLTGLIAHERQKCGSAALAIKSVARSIGASCAWVRKVQGGYGEATIHAHKFLNIVREHVRISRMKRGIRIHSGNIRFLRREKSSAAEFRL